MVFLRRQASRLFERHRNVPKFSLTGTAGLQSVSASDLFNASSHYWSVGPTVTWRIFDYGRIHAQIKCANVCQEQALDSYQQTVLTAFQDIENALVAFANEQARYQALNNSVIANRRSLEIANGLYASGNGDFLNVLDSECSLFGAEDQLVDSQRTVTENLVNPLQSPWRRMGNRNQGSGHEQGSATQSARELTPKHCIKA